MNEDKPICMRDKPTWVKIDKIKKRIYCKSCGDRIDVTNFNQLLCKRCGYRDRAKRRIKK